MTTEMLMANQVSEEALERFSEHCRAEVLRHDDWIRSLTVFTMVARKLIPGLFVVNFGEDENLAREQFDVFIKQLHNSLEDWLVCKKTGTLEAWLLQSQYY